MSDRYYIVDVRADFRGNPFITVWRPNNAGYAYPLSWAGHYDRAIVDEQPNYYHQLRYGTKRALERFPVLCSVAHRFATEPPRGMIDGDAGPVLRNTPQIRAALRKARYIPTRTEGNTHDTE